MYVLFILSFFTFHYLQLIAQKAWIALEVSEAPYEMKEISLYGMNGKPDWFLQMNPSGTVPVLSCYGGAVVYPDSDIILDEIAKGAVEGGANFSSDDDVKVKEWRDDINKRLIPLGKQAVLSSSKSKRKELMSLLKQLDSNVQGPYLCGNEISLADCAAFPFFWRKFIQQKKLVYHATISTTLYLTTSYCTHDSIFFSTHYIFGVNSGLDQEFGPLTQDAHGCGNLSTWLDTCKSTPAFAKTVQSNWWWWW